MANIRCFGMYGLIGGPFPYGLYYSAGLDVLANKLRKLSPDIEVLPTFGFSEWKKIVQDVHASPPNARIVIYGHSMGANQAIAAAHVLQDRNVDVLAAFDPTIWYPIKKLGGNVRHALWFRGVSFLSLPGHGRIRKASSFKGRLETYEVRQRHEKIDDNETLHERVLAAVRPLL